MIRYDLIKDEIFMGEPPPVLYIFGSTNEFHKLVVSFLPFLKKENYSLSTKDISFLFNQNIEIVMNNYSNNGLGISKYRKEITLELDREDWIDVIIELITLSLAPSHSYLEFAWLANLEYTVILETHKEGPTRE